MSRAREYGVNARTYRRANEIHKSLNRKILPVPAAPVTIAAAIIIRPRITPGRIVSELGAVILVAIAVAHFGARHPVTGIVMGVIAGPSIIPGAGIVAVSAMLGIGRIETETFRISASARDSR